MLDDAVSVVRHIRVIGDFFCSCIHCYVLLGHYFCLISSFYILISMYQDMIHE